MGPDHQQLPTLPTQALTRQSPPITIELGPEVPSADAAHERAIDQAWAERCAQNPRLFDGAMIAFESFDPGSGTIRARRERFRRLAAQPGVESNLMLLGVSALLIAEGNEPRVFLGRRGMQTRIYGGMWEFGPSGGLDAPEEGITRMGEPELRAAVRDEIREELRYKGPITFGRPLALDADTVGRAVEVAITARVPSPIGLSPDWEYSEGIWLTTPELRAFAREHADGIITPSRRILGVLGLIDGYDKPPLSLSDGLPAWFGP